MVNTFLRKKTKNIVLSKELQRVVPAVTETGTVTWSLHIQLIYIYIYIIYISYPDRTEQSHYTLSHLSARHQSAINQPTSSKRSFLIGSSTAKFISIARLADEGLHITTLVRGNNNQSSTLLVHHCCTSSTKRRK